MEEILFAILEFLFEAVLQVLAEFIAEFSFELLCKSLSSVISPPEEKHPWFEFAGYFLFGAFFGGLSLFALPHPLMRSTRFHGISLLISPLATGYSMDRIGRRINEGGKPRMRIASFQNGFAFALGMALIRFLFTK